MRRTLVAGFTAFMAMLTPADAKQMQAPNSRVSLDLPEDYTPATRFSGFLQEATGASIVVFEAPSHAYEEMASGFTPEALAAKGIGKAVAGQLAIAAPHVFIRAEQSTPQGVFEKLFVLTRLDGTTVLVSANVPRTAIEQRRAVLADIEKALTSVAVGARVEAQPASTLGYLGPFKDAGAIMGSARLFTRDGRIEPAVRGEVRAVFILAPSLDKQPILDLGSLAESALRSLADYDGLSVTKVEAVQIANLSGLAHEARASAKGGKEPVVLYQVMLAGRDGGYTRILGIAPAAEAPALLPEFRMMATSLIARP